MRASISEERLPGTKTSALGLFRAVAAQEKQPAGAMFHKPFQVRFAFHNSVNQLLAQGHGVNKGLIYLPNHS